VGGVILNYLLEKSRVVRQTAGEENFHVFYQLVYGADPALLGSLQLHADTDHYQYTRSAQVCVPGRYTALQQDSTTNVFKVLEKYLKNTLKIKISAEMQNVKT